MRRILTAAWVVALGVPAGARAQGPPATEMSIALEHFGVGDVVRPGDWAAISVLVSDAGARAREVIVETRLTDADGDRPRPMRAIASNPGVENQRVWLYARLPYWFAGGGTIPISVYEAERSEEGELRTGRLIVQRSVTPRRVLAPPEGMIGVVGRTRAGLGPYETRYGANDTWLATGHERTEIVDGIGPPGFPDRWQGLIPFDAIVWAEGDPWDLTAERAEAIKDWVRAGGHFVVILPRVGSQWLTPRSNPLYELLPRMQVTRIEDAPLEDFRPLLTSAGGALPDAGTIVHTFDETEGVAPSEGMRILEDARGRCVVARRLHGTGAVTLIGLDVTQSAIVRAGGVEADVFWHRVLGRRGPLYDERELAGVLAASQFNAGLRNPVLLDGAIPLAIAKTGRAAAGVLLGLVIFAIYWALAGPGGFALLKLRRMTRHAWLTFALTSAIFSVLAWTGATAIRPGRVEVSHLRLLDHVFGQPVQRARTWASVLIPWYGEAEISVAVREEEAGAGPGELGAIAPWDPPVEIPAPSTGFPDARGYPVPAWGLASIRVPARATVKQVRADWSGAPRWAMPIPKARDDGTPGEIRLRPPPGKAERVAGLRDAEVEGVLEHDLPAPLSDVVVVVCRGLKDSRELELEAGGVGALLSSATAYSLPTPWRPGEPLNLGVVTRVERNRDVSAEAYLKSLTPQGGGLGVTLPTRRPGKLTEDLTALAFFPLLEPPDIRSVRASAPLVRRVETHGWDLARWFTRPCLIVVGHLVTSEEEGGPGAIAINGRVAPARGRTVVRWIYPLDPAPPRLTVPARPMPSGEGAGGVGDGG